MVSSGALSLREILTGSRFRYGAEIVTTRGFTPPGSSSQLVDMGAKLLADPRIGWVSITDNPGGTPMLPPDWLARQLAAEGSQEFGQPGKDHAQEEKVQAGREADDEEGIGAGAANLPSMGLFVGQAFGQVGESLGEEGGAALFAGLEDRDHPGRKAARKTRERLAEAAARAGDVDMDFAQEFSRAGVREAVLEAGQGVGDQDAGR